MTDQERLAYAQERIAHMVAYAIQHQSSFDNMSNDEIADFFLSLKDDQGNPLLAILSEEQGLPSGIICHPEHEGLLSNAGFRRVIL